MKTTELAGGYSFQLRMGDELFRNAAEWVTLERRCCPFLTFELRWPPGDVTEAGLRLYLEVGHGHRAAFACSLEALEDAAGVLQGDDSKDELDEFSLPPLARSGSLRLDERAWRCAVRGEMCA